MHTLGIETSCDETACAVLRGRDEVLANVISSSLARHKPFGGVVPEIASRHALEAMDLVYREALKEAHVKPADFDLIAVTRGPGLIGSLFVGVSFAKALSFALGIPMIGVNHIEAHLEVNFLGKKRPHDFIGLVVSGGHTVLVRAEGYRYRLLGETVDDAIGEAYDKAAKILGLGYPGGPVIDRLAQKGNPKAFSFTKPKQEGKFDFSFSGIKTAVLNLCERTSGCHSRASGNPQSIDSRLKHSGMTEWSNTFVQDLCAGFQESVMKWVTDKTLLACESEGIKTIVVGGGVSANSRLRTLLEEAAGKRDLKLFLPPLHHTTDNAVMIAQLGRVLYRSGVRSDFRMAADPSLRIGEEN